MGLTAQASCRAVRPHQRRGKPRRRLRRDAMTAVERVGPAAYRREDGPCFRLQRSPLHISTSGSRLPCRAVLGGTTSATQRGSIAISIAVASTCASRDTPPPPIQARRAVPRAAHPPSHLPVPRWPDARCRLRRPARRSPGPASDRPPLRQGKISRRTFAARSGSCPSRLAARPWRRRCWGGPMK